MFGKPKPSNDNEIKSSSDRLRFLGYCLPQGQKEPDTVEATDFSIEQVPAPANVSFLDYSGVILFAGSHMDYWNGPGNTDAIFADIDLREREFFTGIRNNIPFIFLIPRFEIARSMEMIAGEPMDLFARVSRKLGIYANPYPRAHPALESAIVEFREYVQRYGTGYIDLTVAPEWKSEVTAICKDDQLQYGIIFGRHIFFLPCTVPQTKQQVTESVTAAVKAVIAYRRRMATVLPSWIGTFAFEMETKLKRQADTLGGQLSTVESLIEGYNMLKGALAQQSDPLVQTVVRIFKRFFDVVLTVDDKCVEDATLQTQAGEIEAVFEIKGVKGDFKRNNINQIDSHRERLRLAADTPGILIMNTHMEAASLAEKDQLPHPDIIKKAVADRVLMMRTLDLLRFADGVERGIFVRDEMHRLMLGESGWLKVSADGFQVVKK